MNNNELELPVRWNKSLSLSSPNLPPLPCSWPHFRVNFEFSFEPFFSLELLDFTVPVLRHVTWDHVFAIACQSVNNVDSIETDIDQFCWFCARRKGPGDVSEPLSRGLCDHLLQSPAMLIVRVPAKRAHMTE